MLRETLLSCSLALGCTRGPRPVPCSHQDCVIAVGMVHGAVPACSSCPRPRDADPKPSCPDRSSSLTGRAQPGQLLPPVCLP